MLGIHIDVAVTWQRISAGDWVTYAADVTPGAGRNPFRHVTKRRTGSDPRNPVPGLRPAAPRARPRARRALATARNAARQMEPQTSPLSGEAGLSAANDG
jgi:hypothetical protein